MNSIALLGIALAAAITLAIVFGPVIVLIVIVTAAITSGAAAVLLQRGTASYVVRPIRSRTFKLSELGRSCRLDKVEFRTVVIAVAAAIEVLWRKEVVVVAVVVAVAAVAAGVCVCALALVCGCGVAAAVMTWVFWQRTLDVCHCWIGLPAVLRCSEEYTCGGEICGGETQSKIKRSKVK